KPTDANYMRAMIEMSESAGLMQRSRRGAEDTNVRARLRYWLDKMGVDRTGKALGHPVDSYSNRYFDPSDGGCILLDASTNSEFGWQARDWLRGVKDGRPIEHLFFGFPSYEEVPPVVEPWQLVSTSI